MFSRALSLRRPFRRMPQNVGADRWKFGAFYYICLLIEVIFRNVMKSRISVLLVAFAMLFAAAIPETATGKSPKVRNGMIEFPEPARAKGQTDVLQLR